MMARPTRGPRPSRILGLYALSVMDSEGALYGYHLADRIAERTDGGWRPGAGAIYPALESLAERKFARVAQEGRRRIYRITPLGRSHLREIRRNMSWRTRTGPDLIQLWAEIAGPGDPGQFMVESVGRRLESVLAYLSRDEGRSDRHRALREQLLEELQRAERRLSANVPGAWAGRRGSPARRRRR